VLEKWLSRPYGLSRFSLFMEKHSRTDAATLSSFESCFSVRTGAYSSSITTILPLPSCQENTLRAETSGANEELNGKMCFCCTNNHRGNPSPERERYFYRQGEAFSKGHIPSPKPHQPHFSHES